MPLVHQDRQLALALHRISRVDRHIENGGVELGRVCVDDAGLAPDVERDLNPRPYNRGQHVTTEVQTFDNVEVLRF